MIFRYTIIYVTDVEETLRFFETAFGFQRGLLHESGDYGELSTGTTKLAFSSIALMDRIGKSPAKTPPEHPSYEIAFETDDVAAGLQRALAAGAQLVQDVEEMPWGQTTAYVRLRDGCLVEICTPVQTA